MRSYLKGLKDGPGTVIQASDRRYVVDRNGSLRVLDYQPAPKPEPQPEAPVGLVAPGIVFETPKGGDKT